jgi:RecA-family ATPase
MTHTGQKSISRTIVDALNKKFEENEEILKLLHTDPLFNSLYTNFLLNNDQITVSLIVDSIIALYKVNNIINNKIQELIK